MRNIHLKGQDDQETSNLFYYIFLYYLLYISSCQASTKYKRNYDDEKKPLHSVKYDTKNFKKIILWSGDNMFYLIKNQKYTLFYCMK